MQCFLKPIDPYIKYYGQRFRASNSIPQRKKDGRGRPRKDPRDVLNGILWVLRTGAPWKDLPQRYPPYQTCHRWFQTWTRQGVFKKILTELGEDLYQRVAIDIRETFIEGSFTPAKKGAILSALQSIVILLRYF